MEEEKKKLIDSIKRKIEKLENENNSWLTGEKVSAMNNIAIAKHYETIAILITNP